MMKNISVAVIIAMSMLPIQGLNAGVPQPPKVVIADLSFKNVMRGFYAGKMMRVFLDDEGLEKFPYIGLTNDSPKSGTDDKTVALMRPVVSYLNTQQEKRYLVMIEKVQVNQDGTLVSCHACAGEADLYLFKKLSNGQYQLLSRTNKNVEFSGSWGRVSLDLEEVRKNLQPVGKGLMGSYVQNGYTSTGETETWWEMLHLAENGAISMYGLADAGSSNSGNYEKDSPLYYDYDSTLQVISNGQDFYPIQIQYFGEKPDQNYDDIKQVNYKQIYVFNTAKKVYELLKP